jgi:8-oxo-dGTP diphosphatase
MKKIQVACAIIILEEKILVVQRSDTMSLPLKWEFPGGKIESGESDEECIKREIIEELNIKIELISRLTPSRHNYPDFQIELIPFLAKYIDGVIKLAEHKKYLLLKKYELSDLDWAEADIPILNEYLNL